ncbi:uncharacterized protein LOC123542239 [Mercenaria mercenaria]|uniref:uncharacterized protein LOC123542239 n=1 Tax=Mercenaria mercenaria TaxID=6596 RepID=UPI00234EB9C4|nr:uncharacterized protein LOC123542239 [Mercenaria mercenaria]
MAFKWLHVYCLELFVIETILSVDGLRCFKCDSTSNPDVCGADFKLTSLNTSFILDSCDYCIKYRFTNDRVYFRTCSKYSDYTYKLGCDTCRASGTRVRSCYCNENLCNGAVSGLSALSDITLVCLLVYYSLVEFDFKRIYRFI